ncbi:ThiF family adenylyltransferase [Mesorhizobium sp. WSM3224]|uniref:ThiF family adenylyltransferase n=1 Tax=Mesorhizobium sp. WSM3224 TaxID=1040986 RepID=UPI00040023A5|nr:ThiF family adenylyltransferase [Mesorhizobium sp. WSM3224]
MSRLDRQSFLGAQSDAVLDAATIGIVGLGGGGSHIVQQAAHMGIGGYVNADPDIIEDTNTNRLIGGTLADVAVSLPKVAIAERLIRGLQPNARIISIKDDWHNAVDDLKLCVVILGAVDGFKEREQLERFARRHLIPYVDIGMDVHDLGKNVFLVSGQVILSMPGAPCMRCCGFITDERLEQEAKRYGAAGSRPQVVWSNGVLASTAVGLLTQILTPWYPNPPSFVFLDYDGNKGTLTRNPRMELLKNHVCPHHPADETGDPLFDIRKQKFAARPVAAAASPPPHTPWWLRVWNRLRRRGH